MAGFNKRKLTKEAHPGATKPFRSQNQPPKSSKFLGGLLSVQSVNCAGGLNTSLSLACILENGSRCGKDGLGNVLSQAGVGVGGWAVSSGVDGQSRAALLMTSSNTAGNSRALAPFLKRRV